MDDPNQVILEVGDERVEIPPLVWYNLERLEPLLRDKTAKPDADRYSTTRTALAVLMEATVLHPKKRSADARQKLAALIAEKADEAKIAAQQALIDAIESDDEAYREYLVKKLRPDQQEALFETYIKLLAISGFKPVGEAEAASPSPGTGMSNGLSPNAVPEASTEAIGTA
jgi:hypothetical protein